MHVHAHAGTRVHEATSLTGLVPERVQLTVHTTEPTGTVPEPFHCDHIARWSARSGTSGRSGTGLNTGNWNGSGTVLVSNLWCEHGKITKGKTTKSPRRRSLPKWHKEIGFPMTEVNKLANRRTARPIVYLRTRRRWEKSSTNVE